MAKNYLLKRAFIGLGFKYLREKDRIAKNKKQVKQAKKKATEKAINDVLNETLGKNVTFTKFIHYTIIVLATILALLTLLLGALPLTLIFVGVAVVSKVVLNKKLESFVMEYEPEDEE